VGNLGVGWKHFITKAGTLSPLAPAAMAARGQRLPRSLEVTPSAASVMVN
jgi:hypothetical protein